MKRKSNKRLSIILLSIFAFFLIVITPVDKFKNFTKNFLNNVYNLVDNVNNIFFTSDNDSSSELVDNITFKTENNSYHAIISFKNLPASNISSITINGSKYDSFEIQNSKTIKINISNLISSRETTSIKVSKVETINQTYSNVLETTFYKSVNYEIIEEKKKSVVGISARKSEFSHDTSYSWGSGIIFNKKEVYVTFLGSPRKMYEYLIITNYHVVENNRTFEIHYGNFENTYPKSFRDSVTLMGIYKDRTDLAILKLTTTDDSLISLDDQQFNTFDAVPIENKEMVFAIGSPSFNKNIDFNSYKIGHITEKMQIVGQLQDSEICKEGCYSIKTTALQGKGSSGGGVFDLNGNLIGIHFAGNEEAKSSFEIPMEMVFMAINDILINYEVKRSHKGLLFLSLYYFKTDFFNSFFYFI